MEQAEEGSAVQQTADNPQSERPGRHKLTGAKAEEEPAAGVEEEPAAKAEEEPAAKGEDERAAGAEGEPASEGEEEPAAVAENEPAAVAQDESAAEAESEPAAEAHEPAASEAEEEPAAEAHEQAAAEAEEESAAEAHEQAAAEAEEEPAAEAHEQAASEAEEEPAAEADEQAASGAEKEPAAEAHEQAAAEAESEPADSVTIFVESLRNQSPVGWECAVCTLINDDAAQRCDACDELAPAAPEENTAGAHLHTRSTARSTAVSEGSWSCSRCTRLNPAEAAWCQNQKEGNEEARGGWGLVPLAPILWAAPGEVPGDRCQGFRPVEHARAAGPPHRVLASHTYLYLVLFAYADSEVRAKEHGRYQLVCKAWQAYENEIWADYFAPKVAYRWRSELIRLLPAVQHFRDTSNSSFGLSEEKVFCCKINNFAVVMMVLGFVGLIVGLTMVTDAQDGGVLSGKSSYLQAIPFLGGGLAWIVLVAHCLLRGCCRMKQTCQTKAAHKKMGKQLRQSASPVAFTLDAAKQLVRTTSAMPKAAKDIILLVDGNGCERQWDELQWDELQWMEQAAIRIQRAFRGSKLPADNVTTPPESDETYTAEVKWVDSSNWSFQNFLCYENCVTFVCLFAPLTLVGSVALIYATGASAIVAFIPLQLVVVGVLCLQINYIHDHGFRFMIAAFMLPTLSLLAFCITYPLALDGTIPNKSAGDWAAALSPLFVFSFCTTIVLPCAIMVVIYHDLYEGDHWCELKTAAISCGFCCVYGAAGVVNLCFIALCYKGADDWDLMPYAAFSGTIFGAMVTFLLCGVCAMATVRA